MSTSACYVQAPGFQAWGTKRCLLNVAILHHRLKAEFSDSKSSDICTVSHLVAALCRSLIQSVCQVIQNLFYASGQFVVQVYHLVKSGKKQTVSATCFVQV